jgi:ParB-like chromosome segregation protein Spo0J
MLHCAGHGYDHHGPWSHSLSTAEGAPRGRSSFLLHPIVVRQDGCLIAGERRLRACELLGWRNVPVTVIDINQIVRGEFAENAFRRDFLPSGARWSRSNGRPGSG